MMITRKVMSDDDINNMQERNQKRAAIARRVLVEKRLTYPVSITKK